MLCQPNAKEELNNLNVGFVVHQHSIPILVLFRVKHAKFSLEDMLNLDTFVRLFSKSLILTLFV